MDIAVVTCNSSATVEACLRSTRQAQSLCDSPGRLLVVDDASQDDTLQRVGSALSGEDLIVQETRQGFPATANRAINASSAEHCLLLNADVILDPYCLVEIEKAFQAPDVVAASPLAVLGDGFTVDMARCTARMERGWWRFAHDQSSGSSQDTLYASGGYLAIRKEVFSLLSGFRLLYSPGYWEDVDLCYRAWKRGFRIRFQPTAKVTHLKGHAFSVMYTPEDLDILKARNRFLFMWLNLDRDALASHLAWLPLKVSSALVHRKTGFLIALSQAFSKFHPIREQRGMERRFWKRTDREILRGVAS